MTSGDCREVHYHKCDTCWDDFPCDRECRETQHWITCPQCERKETQRDIMALESEKVDE